MATDVISTTNILDKMESIQNKVSTIHQNRDALTMPRLVAFDEPEMVIALRNSEAAEEASLFRSAVVTATASDSRYAATERYRADRVGDFHRILSLAFLDELEEGCGGRRVGGILSSGYPWLACRRPPRSSARSATGTRPGLCSGSTSQTLEKFFVARDQLSGSGAEVLVGAHRVYLGA